MVSVYNALLMLKKPASLCLLTPLLLCAFEPAAEWTTFGGDPQRSNWAKEETELTRDSIHGLKLEWKLKLDNESKELTSLTAPLVHSQVITPHGFKEVVLIAGASDTVFAIDADTGKLMWKKTMSIDGTPTQKQVNWLCPNALNATPVIDRRARTVYVAASDGRLHAFNLVNGEDRFPPVQFFPAFAKPWSLNLVGDVLYTVTSQRCNGVKSGVYAMNLTDPHHQVSYFEASSAGAGIWGRAGAAATLEGNIVIETGDGPYDPSAGKLSDTMIELSGKDLKLVDYYTPANRAYLTKKDLDMGNMSPVIFTFKNWELAAGAGKEGVIYLVDVKSMGGADHRTPLYRSPLYTNEDVDFAGHGFWGAMATWEDPSGARWIYAPALGPPVSNAPKFPLENGETQDGSVMAFKVEEKDGKPVLTPAWKSRNMSYPEPPVIANGMIFALSSGENVKQVDSNGRLLTSKERFDTPVGNATLYILDAATGKELYSSGKTMPSFSHFSAPVVSGGRVYVVTWDNTVYAFGLGQ
jgi:outer membrane protein assembly factor BamB